MLTKPASISLKSAKAIIKKLLIVEKLHGVKQTPMLWGKPGQGKTAIIEQLVDELNSEGTVQWTHLNFRLLQCEPTDLKGVPLYEEIDSSFGTTYAPPISIPIMGMPHTAGGKNVIIFLDELPQCPQALQNLAANIIDGKIGDKLIDFDRTYIVAAGNRPEDQCNTYELSQHLSDRLIHLYVETELPEWEEWAVPEGINPIILGYLKCHPTLFNPEVPEDGRVYPNPRSWHRLSCQLSVWPDWVKDITGLHTAQGTIGISEAYAFYQFLKVYQETFNIEDIYLGRPLDVSTIEKDLLYSFIYELGHCINRWVGEVLTHPEYIETPLSDRDKKAEKLVEILGEKTKYISNIYQWIFDSKIDPAFQVLILKCETDEVKTHLKYPLMFCPEFKIAGEIHAALNKKLLCR